MNTHASNLNEITHFNYLYIGPGGGEVACVLLIQDENSSYRCLYATGRADADSAAEILACWIRVFTVMDMWVSDQGSHFKN